MTTPEVKITKRDSNQSRRQYVTSVANMVFPDRPYPEQRLPGRHGSHCWCPHLPPGSCYRQGWLLESHARFMDHFSHLPGFCPEVPSRPALDSLLQHRVFHHWHIHQHDYQEEAPRSSPQEALRRRPPIQRWRHAPRPPRRLPSTWHGRRSQPSLLSDTISTVNPSPGNQEDSQKTIIGVAKALKRREMWR